MASSLLDEEDDDQFGTGSLGATASLGASSSDDFGDLEDAPEVEESAPLETPAIEANQGTQPQTAQPQEQPQAAAQPAEQSSQRKKYSHPPTEKPLDVQAALGLRQQLIDEPYEPVSHMGAVDPREELRLQAESQRMEEESRRQREAQRRQIEKGLKAQGVEFETDALGNEDIARNPDGSPRFKAGVVTDFEWDGDTPTRVERDAHGNRSRVSILEVGTPGKDYHRDDASGEYFVDTKDGRQWLGARDDQYIQQRSLAAIRSKARADAGMSSVELADTTARMRQLKADHAEKWEFMDEAESDLASTVEKRMKEFSGASSSILPDPVSWLPGGQTREHKAKVAAEAAKKAQDEFYRSPEYKARIEYQQLEAKQAELRRNILENRRRIALASLQSTALKYNLAQPEVESDQDRRQWETTSGVGGTEIKRPALYAASMTEETETGERAVKPDALLDRATALASAAGRKVEEMVPMAVAEAKRQGLLVPESEAQEKRLYRISDGKISFGTGDPMKGLAQAVGNGDISIEEATREVKRIMNQPVKGNGVGRAQDHAWRALIATSNSVNSAFAGLARFVGADDLAKDFSDQAAVGEKSKKGKLAITNPELDDSWGGVLSETAGEIAGMAPGLAVGGGAGMIAKAGAGLFNTLKIGTLAPRLIGVLPLGLQGAATAQETAYRQAKEAKKSDEEAEAIGNQAALKTLPYLALVAAAGALTDKALRPLTRIYPILETPFARGLTASAIDAPLNVGASLVGQYATGEEVKLDAKSVATDLVFSLLAGHNAATAAKFLPTARAMADGSHLEIQALRATAADNSVDRKIRKTAFDQANQLQAGARKAIDELGAKPEGASVEHIAAMNRLRELDASPDSAKVRDERAEVSEAANRALGRMVNSDQAATESILRELVGGARLGAAAKVAARENPGDAGAAVLVRLGEKAVQSGVIPPSMLKRLEASVAHLPEANRQAVLNHAIGAAVFGDTYLPVLKGDAVSSANLGYLSVLQDAGVISVTPEGRSKMSVNYLFMLPKLMREQIARNPGERVADGDGLRDVARIIREGHTGVVGASEKLAAQPEPQNVRRSDIPAGRDQAAWEAAEADRQYIDAIPDEAIPFSRGKTALVNGMKKADVEKAVAKQLRRFKNTSEVEVIQSYEDLSPAVRGEYRSKGVNAFYDSATAKVTIIADRMQSPSEAVKTALHEIVGHHGLRGAFGDNLQRVVDRMVTENRQGVIATARRLGLDLKEPSQRREAAEEYIAEMAEAGANPSSVKRLSGWLKGTLEKVFPGVKFDDAYVRGILDASREFVESGKKGGMQGDEVRFSSNEKPVDANLNKRYDEKDAGRKTTSSDRSFRENAEDLGGNFEDAARIIRGVEGSDEGASREVQERDRVVEWARREGRLISDSDFEKHPPVSNSTSEHEVWRDIDQNRAVKRTWAGFYGQIPDPLNGKLDRRNATPSEYLERMALQNRVFGTDNRLEGVNVSEKPSMIIGQSSGEPSFVVSQRWISGKEAPAIREVREYLESEGFRNVPDSYFGWYRPEDGVVIIDAKPDNFVKTEAGVVPIDLQMKQFSRDELKAAGLDDSRYGVESGDIRFSKSPDDLQEAADKFFMGPVVEKGIKGFRRLYEGAADVLERTKGLEHLGKAVRKQIDRAREVQGKASSVYADLHRKEGKKVFERAEDEVSKFYSAKDRTPEEAARIEAMMSDEGRVHLAAWRSIAKSFAAYADRLNVMVKQADGKVRKMGVIDDYHQRMLRRDYAEAMADPVGNKKKWEEVVNLMISEGFGKNAEEVMSVFRQAGYVGTSSNDFFGNVERARELKLPNKLYDYSFDARRRYILNAAERLSQIEYYGQRIGDVKDSSRPDWMKDIFEKLQKGIIDKATGEYVESVRERVYGETPRTMLHRTMSILNSIATGTMLSNPLTVATNLASGLGYSAATTGFRNNLRALKEITHLGDLVAEARRKGVILDDLMDLHRDAEQLGSSVAAKTSYVAGKMLKWSGFNASEDFVRAISMAGARNFLREGLNAWAKDPTSRKARKAEAFFKRNNLNAEKLFKENGEGTETDRFLRAAVNASQGGYRVDQTPVYIDTPLGKFFFKFQKWGSQATRNFAKNVVEPLVGVNGPVDVAPALRYLAATAAIGAGLAAFKEGVFGSPDNTASLEEIGKTWSVDGRRAIALAMNKLFGYQLNSGAYGLLGNYGQMAWDLADRSRFKNPLQPPGVSTAMNAGEQFLRLMEQGKLTEKDAHDYLKAQISAYRTGVAATGKIGGLPLEKNRQELAWLRAQTRRFADEIGVEAARTSLGRIGKTPDSPLMRDINDALMEGDSEAAKAKIKQYLDAAQTPEARKIRRRSIQQSIRARNPIKVGSTGEARRELFLKWANERLPKDDIERIREIDKTYRRAAERTGLFKPSKVTERQRRELAARVEAGAAR